MTPERRRQVEELYGAALERPATERLAWVAQRCAGDDELRVEVEARLASSKDTQLAAPLQRTASAAGRIASGVSIGSYRVDKLLGAGGMGVVYRAVDTRLDRPVAIKFVAEGLLDAEASERFAREARMASALNHPHILTVHDVGDYAGKPYIVAELVDGPTLADWLNDEPRTWRQSVELMIGVADALAAAHAANILHRDVKPANIFVSRTGYAKLADFGLAKTADATQGGRAEARNTLSQHSAVVGTVGYMAPEQLEGRAVDARSDIFAFGVVLYEVLTRRSPFAGNTDRDVIDAVVHQEPQPLPPDLPEALRTIVEKALEKDPADRYQSMRDLVVDLKRVARRTASAEVRAPADAARPPAAARSRRKWAVAATAAALAGFLVIGIALDFGDRAREADARAAMAGVPAAGDLSIIVLPFANQTGDSQKEYIADAVTSSITSALDYIDEADVVPIQTAYTYKEKTLTVQQIAQDAGVRFVLSGNVQAAGSQARIGVQLSGGAGAATIWNETITGDLNDIFALQDRVATLVAGSLGREMIVAADREQGKLAEDAETADLLLRAKALSWQSVTFDKHRQQEELFRTVLAREPDNRTALAGLAISIATRASWGFYEPKTIAKQGELFAEAEKLAERVDELSAGTEPLQDVRGWAAMFRGDFEMAERMFNALREQLPLNPDPYNALGVLAYMRYEPKQALELFKHADEVSAAAAPDFYFANSAIAYLELGDYEAVIDNVEKALTVNPQFHNVLPLAAVAYSLRGNDAAAASWAARARAANVTEPDVMGLAAGSAAYEAWANSVLRPTWRKLGLPE